MTGVPVGGGGGTADAGDAARQALDARRQRELDEDRALVELDESIATREQLIADHEQELVDALQQSLDAEEARDPAPSEDARAEREWRRHGLAELRARRDAALTRAQAATARRRRPGRRPVAAPRRADGLTAGLTSRALRIARWDCWCWCGQMTSPSDMP